MTDSIGEGPKRKPELLIHVQSLHEANELAVRLLKRLYDLIGRVKGELAPPKDTKDCEMASGTLNHAIHWAQMTRLNISEANALMDQIEELM